MTKSDDKFTRIVEVDDWASAGYYLKAKLSASGTWSHRSLDQTHRLKNGDKLEVLLPDGTVVKATARVTVGQTSYSDMGHIYETTTEHLVLVPSKKLQLHGLDVNFTDLKKVRVRRAR